MHKITRHALFSWTCFEEHGLLCARKPNFSSLAQHTMSYQFLIPDQVLTKPIFCYNKAIYLGVIITAKNHFGHICAWYVINSIILLKILNHFFCSALLNYYVIESELELGLSDSNKTSPWCNFVVRSLITLPNLIVEGGYNSKFLKKIPPISIY